MNPPNDQQSEQSSHQADSFVCPGCHTEIKFKPAKDSKGLTYEEASKMPLQKLRDTLPHKTEE